MTLQQLMFETGEVTTLVENVKPRRISYSGDIVVFERDIVSDEEYALVAFHIPTQSEIEISRTSASLTSVLRSSNTAISPNGRWLTYVTGDSQDSAVITVREIIIQGQQLTLSEPVLTITQGNGWNWPYDYMMWPTENEISWSDESGIWIADLNSSSIEPVVAIAPSANTFLMASLNPADSDKDPVPVFTTFIPYLWSPDGRYLLIEEHFFEYGELRVIERDTNRIIEVPESTIGPISDDALWLDETTLLHYQASGTIHIWHIDPNRDPFMTLQKNIPAVSMGYVGELWFFNNHVQASDYVTLYEVNLETGELTELVHDIGWPLYWSPNGQHVLWNNMTLIDGERQDHVYLSDLQNKPIELDDVLGLNSCCWYWYEE